MGRIPPPPPPECRRSLEEALATPEGRCALARAVGPTVVRERGFGGSPMIIADPEDKPKGAGCYRCSYCGDLHRELDLKSLNRCPTCGGNQLLPVGPRERTLRERTLREMLDYRKRTMSNYRRTLHGMDREPPPPPPPPPPRVVVTKGFWATIFDFYPFNT